MFLFLYVIPIFFIYKYYVYGCDIIKASMNKNK